MARVSKPDTWTCDECGEDMSEHRRRYHLDMEGARTMADHPDGYDFCSRECLSSWAANRHEARRG